jgi:hypothetical protein
MDREMIKKDRLRYTNNKLSAKLTYLAIVFDVLFFVSIYRSNVNMYYYNIKMGISVLMNLIFLLVAFLCSEGVKSYKINYAYTLLGVGVLQLIRIFGYPMAAHAALTKVNAVEVTVMSDKQFVYTVACLVASAVACFAAGIIGIVKTRVLENYKKEHGYV